MSQAEISNQAQPVTAADLPTRQPRISRAVCFVLLALILVFFAALRWRLRNVPLERDEGEYAYAGQLMLHGIAPYAHLYSMKLPGTFAAYAVILAVFGQSATGIHLGLLVINAATTLLLFLIARKLLGDLAGLIAAASYGLLSTSPAVLGFAGHATHFVVLAAMAGTWLLLIAIERQRPALVFASGLLFGTAFLMKQPGIMFVIFGGVYLAWTLTRQSQGTRRNLASQLAIYAVGAALPFLLTCTEMLASGAFRNFWFWTFSYSRQYATTIGVAEGLDLLRLMLPKVMVPCLGIWLIAVLGAVTPIWGRGVRSHRFFLWMLLASSTVAACAGFYFRAHYFILLLPAASLLAASAVSDTAETLQRQRRRMWAYVPVAIFIAASATSLYTQRDYLFQIHALAATRVAYGNNPFAQAREAAEYLRNVTPPDARIAVLGSEPEIYFYADRRAATGYIYTYGLMENQPYAGEMQKQMIAEIEAAGPEYIAYINLPTSFGRLPSSQTLIFQWMDRYLPANYQEVGRWPIGQETAADGVPTRTSVRVFKRR